MKFKDADLIGIPIRIAVGKRGLAEGKAEFKLRDQKDVELVPLGEVARPRARARWTPSRGRMRGGGASAPGEGRVRARLSVGADGEIALPAAGRRGARACRRGPRWTSSRRAAGSPSSRRPPGTGPSAWFAGSLASLTVPEVVQFIFTTLKSGTLTLAFGADARRVAEAGAGARPHRRTLYFREGQVVFASSSDPADRLGAGALAPGDRPCRPTSTGAASSSAPAARSGRSWWTRGSSPRASSTRRSPSR